MITSPYPTPLSTALVQARLIAKFRCDPVKKKKQSYKKYRTGDETNEGVVD